VTTDVVQTWHRTWQASGISNPTINRRCNMLRRAFRLGQRARKVHVAPFIPRLKEQSARGRYITRTTGQRSSHNYRSTCAPSSPSPACTAPEKGS
jgi:hypothetical protein